LILPPPEGIGDHARGRDGAGSQDPSVDASSAGRLSMWIKGATSQQAAVARPLTRFSFKVKQCQQDPCERGMLYDMVPQTAR